MKPTIPLADRIAQAISDPGSIDVRRHNGDTPETVTRWSTRAVLYVLKDVARTDPTALLGRPTSISVEYDVAWHSSDPYADRHAGTCMSHHGWIGYLHRAIAIAEVRVEAGQYGITHYTIYRREHRFYVNGTSWTSAWRRLELPELVTEGSTR